MWSSPCNRDSAPFLTEAELPLLSAMPRTLSRFLSCVKPSATDKITFHTIIRLSDDEYRRFLE